MSIIELLAVALGLVSVALLGKGDGRGWALGVGGGFVAAYAYWDSNLLGSWALQLYFLSLQLVGWWKWRKTAKADLRISSKRSSRREVLLTLGILLFLWSLVSCVLHFAGASFPLLDGLVTSLSLVAQAGLVLGRVESWILWIVADVLYVGLSSLTGMWAFAFAYFVYTGIAVAGWTHWTREST